MLFINLNSHGRFIATASLATLTGARHWRQNYFMEYITFNVKPSNRILDRFKAKYPQAGFTGRKWKSKVTQFKMPAEVYEANKEDLKQYGTKARD